jgi:putative FmdB family regulatory protein
MPSFDYVCGACEAAFEALVKSVRSRPACPRCGSRRASRAPALIAVRRESKAAPALPHRGKPAGGCGLIERLPAPAPAPAPKKR